MRTINEAISIDEGRSPGQPDAELSGYLYAESDELKGSGARAAVVICPGGGYFYKSDREADPVAMRLSGAGFQTFVLQYSVAPSRYPRALLELAACVERIRKNAGEWNIDPKRVFVCGFSAGAHVCATLGTKWNDPAVAGRFRDVRPDGMLLCYPVITMGQYAHEGSRDLLLGESFGWNECEELSAELHVTPETPPAFLWHTCEDELVPVENSLLMAAALRKNRVPFELHIYERGRHGLSLCDESTENESWQLQSDDAGWVELAIRWLRRQCGRVGTRPKASSI